MAGGITVSSNPSGTANTRINVTSSGKYQVNFIANWSGGTSGIKSVGYRINGGSAVYLSDTLSANNNNLFPSVILNLNAGDYIEMLVKTSASGTTNLGALLKAKLGNTQQ